MLGRRCDQFGSSHRNTNDEPLRWVGPSSLGPTLPSSGVSSFQFANRDERVFCASPLVRSCELRTGLRTRDDKPIIREQEPSV